MEMSCAICHEALDLIKHSGATKCGHVFHLSCIFKWLALNTTCPTCRAYCVVTAVTKIFFSITPKTTGKIPLERVTEMIPLQRVTEMIPLTRVKKMKDYINSLHQDNKSLKFELKRLASRKNRKIKWV